MNDEVKLIVDKWEPVSDDSVMIHCNVTRAFTSIKYEQRGFTIYMDTQLEPKMKLDVLVRKITPMIEESESDLPIIGEILRRASAELSRQGATIIAEFNGKEYTNKPTKIEQEKEAF